MSLTGRLPPEGYGPLTEAERAALPQEYREALIHVDGQYYQGSVFLVNAQASAAKAVVFSAEAHVAVSEDHLIWAAIGGYYSLFHLGLSVLFLLPQRLPLTVLSRLIAERKGGREDPSYVIQHKPLRSSLLLPYEAMGLSSELRTSITQAYTLREFVNYAPRVVWREKGIIFRSLEHRPAAVIAMATRIPQLISDTFLWITAQGSLSKQLVAVVKMSLVDFLVKDDLMYSQWCSSETLAYARELASGLTNALQRPAARGARPGR